MKVSEIAKRILKEMGGDAEKICTGYCPDFAKELIDTVGRGQIVSNLSDEMKDEIEGYETIEPEIRLPDPNNWRLGASHCWVKIDEKFYDAFNPEGVDQELDLEFIQNL